MHKNALLSLAESAVSMKICLGLTFLGKKNQAALQRHSPDSSDMSKPDLALLLQVKKVNYRERLVNSCSQKWKTMVSIKDIDKV